MLNSILKFTIFIAIVAALALGVNFLLSSPEADGAVVTFRGAEYRFTPIAFVFTLLLLFAALYVAFKVLGLVLALIRFIAGDETAVTRYFDRSRERRGLDALGQALAAIQSGDTKKARMKAQKAEKLMRRPALTRLVSAQAAEMSGDIAKAKSCYRDLADDSDTAFVGVSGLLRIAQAEGDTESALILARTAAALRSDHAETLDALYRLQSKTYDWEGARVTLGAQKRAKMLDEKEAQRRDSMLVLAQSAEAEEAGRGGEALKFAVDAAKIDPTNAEAVEKAAQMLSATGASKQATKVIADAWKAAPSPKLARAFAELEPKEEPDARRRRFAELFSANPEHVETHYTRAEVALADGDWKSAREALAKVTESDPSARYCAIMAAVSRGEGAAETEVRGWLARAVSAPKNGMKDAMISDASMLPLLVGTDATPEERREAAG